MQQSSINRDVNLNYRLPEHHRHAAQHHRLPDEGQARGCVRACRVFWVNTARPAAGLLPRLRCEESLVPGMGSLITLIRAEAVGWHPKAVTGARSALFCSALLYSAILSSVLLRPRAQIVGADIESEHMSSHCFSLWR
ncbi:uncharacterized [Tachysurus ichikawai]